MAVYYFMIEAVPCADSEERLSCGGAYINCWVKAETEKAALAKVMNYAAEEKWTCKNVEEVFPARREMYLDEPESLAGFDEAQRYGLSAIFYTWPLEEA